MPAPSLSAMAQNAAIRNIANITDIADLPYHCVEPILRRIDNPTQLHEIEVACPHVAEHTGPLWQVLIKRDVVNAESKMLYPKDPRSWWKVYRKMCKQEAADKQAAEDSLKRAMQGLKEAKGNKETTFVAKNLEQSQKKKSGFFDGVAHMGNKKPTPMLWNAKNGRDAFGAMQRASADKVRGFRTGPRTYIPNASSQILVPPKSMVVNNAAQEAVKRAAAEAKKYAERSTLRARTIPSLSVANRTENMFKREEAKDQYEREQRLRALTAPKARPAMHPAPAPAPVARTASPPKNEASSSRPVSVPRRNPAPAPISPPKRAREEVTFPPSPTSSSSAANKPSQASQPQRPTLVKRKRPAADPFVSTKKSRT